MATPSTRATKAGTTPAAETETAETGTEVETTSVEQDVAGTQAEQNAAALAAAEPVADPRESALAALLSGEADPVITPADEPEIDTSNVIDFGGKSKAVVLFSRYNQDVDGVFAQARKGDVIATTAEHLKRGVRIGALKKLEG
jgi:hypothetical protein